jgi:hypothetical protein
VHAAAHDDCPKEPLWVLRPLFGGADCRIIEPLREGPSQLSRPAYSRRTNPVIPAMNIEVKNHPSRICAHR